MPTTVCGPLAVLGLVACGGGSGPPGAAEPVSVGAATTPAITTVSDAAASRTQAALPITDASVLDGMLLHLPDAPEGARVGDDSTCGGGFSSEGGSDAFLDLVAATGDTAVGCFIQLEAPTVFIESLVVSFADAETASRGVEPLVLEGIARYHGLACCSAEEPGAFTSASIDGRPGVEAVGPTDASAIVGWQYQHLVGAVAVQHVDGTPGAAAAAHQLAGVQLARMESPVAVPDDIDDDRFVGLSSAPFETWWLGETFAAPGYPTMQLVATDHYDGLAIVDYAGIRIEIFDLAAIAPGEETSQMLGVANELFDSACTSSEPVASSIGAAQLLGRFVPDEYFGVGQMGDGWGALLDDVCPAGEPNVWMATIAVDDRLLVRVNAPICYNCLRPPDAELPYFQPDGLRSVIAGLQPYRP